MKKILSLVLALLMIVSCISMVAAEDTAITDEVVETEDAGSYEFAIEFLTKYGIYKGGEPASADIQRYQMALFVARIATGWTDDATWEDGTLNSSEFVDIDTAPANNYYGAISYVNQKGIIEGYGDGNFGPYDGITYQDALTMLVRTLGWNNLKYPWGVIEQAIEIGLTEGIEGVAYTDVLTRAEVAQLVYNALFINGKDGLTLASTSFDMEDGWQTVIITSTPYGVYANDAFVGGGKVGFRVLNADGSMGNTLYTANASEFGFSGTESAENLGYVYKIIFEANNRNLAKVLAYKSLYLETLWNNGATDDNGKNQLNAIEAWLATQKIVTKYSDDEYYYGTGFATDEFILISAEEQYGTKTVVTDKAKYGINWATGDIVELAWNGNTASIAKTLWYYQAELDTYFQYKFDANGTTVVTHYMTEADFAELPALLQERLTAEVTTAGRYLGFALSDMTFHSVYASLELFDTNEDGVADRGYYERYQFGRISFGSTTCSTCKVSVPTVTFHNVGNEPANRTSSNDAWKFNPDPGNGYYNTGSTYLSGEYSYTEALAGTCAHTGKYWFNSDYAVSENVIGMFKYDTATGEIKVIKTVEDKDVTTDADTFSSKGMVKAWSVTKRTVTIVDEDGTIGEYTLDYKDLFRYEHVWSDYWGLYSKFFAQKMETMFMNYVNYIVVDGRLVSITLDGVDTENVIVVDEYLGLCSETGLITVAGYSTSDLKRKEFKLLTVDGWIAGDWFNTSNASILETMAKTFSMGAVLNITSYDKDLKAYNVDIAGEYDANGKFVVNTTNGLNSSTITLDFTGAANNYYYKNGSLTTGAKDVEVLVIFPYSNGHTTVAKFNKFDKAHEGWYIKGTKINHAGNRHVIIADEWEGFANIGGGKVSIIQVIGMAGAAHAEFIRKGYYITGSTKTDYIGYDIATGRDIYVSATNLKVKMNELYVTHDDVIVCTLEEATNGNTADFMQIFINAYGLNSARYGDGNEWVVGSFQPTGGDYNHNWVKQYIIPVYAANWIAELDALYGGHDIYWTFYNKMVESFFTGYADNEEGVKLYDVNRYGIASVLRFYFWRHTTDANGNNVLDRTYGNNGIKFGYVGGSPNAWEDTFWVGSGWTFYYIINTKTGSTVFLADTTR